MCIRDRDILELSKIRYALSTNSFKKYMAVTIASNISEKSVAAIREDQPELQGIDIVEDSVRKYINDASMGPILGLSLIHIYVQSEKDIKQSSALISCRSCQKKN